MTGLEFDYKQALTFLPHWARGVQVFANASAQRATGDASSNFQGYVPRSGSWGASLSRPKFNVKFNHCESYGVDSVRDVRVVNNLPHGTLG